MNYNPQTAFGNKELLNDVIYRERRERLLKDAGMNCNECDGIWIDGPTCDCGEHQCKEECWHGLDLGQSIRMNELVYKML